MTRRILLCGLLGGLAMFVWTSLAHMVLPLGEAGVQEIPNDGDLLDALHAKLGETPGLYLYPGFGLPPDASRQQKNAAMAAYGEKLAQHPSGLLIYHPPGAKELTAGQLTSEFLTELCQALLLAWLLARAQLATFGARFGMAVAAGLMAAITTNLSYWTWYGFPVNYTLATMTTQFVGFAAAGLVAAKMLGKAKPVSR